jgi:anti-sigma-K factor RskA
VDAIEQYEWAVRAYTPFSNTPRQAIERLERIACDAEVSHDTGTAIHAWQAILSGLAVVENVVQPYSEILTTAESRLEDLRNKPKRDIDPPEGEIIE